MTTDYAGLCGIDENFIHNYSATGAFLCYIWYPMLCIEAEYLGVYKLILYSSKVFDVCVCPKRMTSVFKVWNMCILGVESWAGFHKIYSIYSFS